MLIQFAKNKNTREGIELVVQRWTKACSSRYNWWQLSQ
jgi:hypothetical protein